MDGKMPEIETEEQMTAEPESTGVQRGEPELDQANKQFIGKWQAKIRAAKEHYKDDFKRMREDMKIARQGADKEWIEAKNYVVPIINRYLNQAVAALYAKNPTAYAERRKTLDFSVWDGTIESAQKAVNDVMTLGPQITQMATATAVEAATQGGVDPKMLAGAPQLAMAQQQFNESKAVVDDIQQGKQRRDLINKVGRTLEILFDYFSNEQKPRLKPSMKAMVRRAKTCGVGYLMIGFQRNFAELTPDETAKLEDSRNKMGELQRRMQDFMDGEISDSENSDELVELQSLIADLESKRSTILREGPVFMFPRATEIIVDPRCRQLMGFVGAGWIVREFHKSPDEIQKLYNVDVKSKFTPYKDGGADKMAAYHRAADSDESASGKNAGDSPTGLGCIWEVYNKDLGQTFTLLDGFTGYLKTPAEPEYWMEGFWPVFAITFNDSEDEENLYPLSDVYQLRHVQNEYNRSREYRRLHREANKPKYMVVKGRLSKEDLEKLTSAESHAVIELDGMGTGEKVENLIQRFQSIALDPALYETNSEMEDVLRTVGAQEANIGGSSGGTATESSIAESSRMTSLSSSIDDLDEFLSDVVSATGQLMLREMSKETVMEIAGMGAVWPELSPTDVAKELMLKTRAGSSGRPNKAADLANMERAMPYLLQMPGINPNPIIKKYLDLLEIDATDIMLEGMPSITAINGMMSRGMMGGAMQGFSQGIGGPGDPNQQGPAGQTNADSTQKNEPGGQPAYPAQ